MIFDTHAHYDDEKFDEDRDELIAEMLSHGICGITDVGSSMASVEAAVRLAEKWPEIYAAVGVHPDNADELNSSSLKRLEELAHKKKVVAIGEIGLDYYWDKVDHDIQKDAFRAQTELAKKLSLPVIIHSRDAAKDTFDLIKETRAYECGGVIHCFSYSSELAREYVKMGFFIGIGGVSTFKNAKTVKEVIRDIPLSSIVLETDSPYLAPVPHRGKRNCSLYLNEVVRAVAELKETDEKIVEEQTLKNAVKLYNLEGEKWQI